MSEKREEQTASFAEIAVGLKILAWIEAAGVEKLEYLAALHPEQVYASTLREARLNAMLCGQAHELLKALIPHEVEVRKLLAG